MSGADIRGNRGMRPEALSDAEDATADDLDEAAEETGA